MIQTILMRLVSLFPFCLEDREISYLMTPITTSKTTIYTCKTHSEVLVPTSSTSMPFKSISISLRTFVGKPIHFPHGKVLIIEHLFGLRLTLLIRPRPLSIPINLSNVGILNWLIIHREPRDLYYYGALSYDTLLPPNKTLL